MVNFLNRSLCLAACAASLFGAAPGRQKRTVTDEEVMRVHKSTILIDTHNDITGRTVAGMDIGQPSTETHTDLPRMKKGGMGGQFFAVFVASSYVEGNHSANRALQMIDTVKHDIVAQISQRFPFRHHGRRRQESAQRRQNRGAHGC